ncbi:hypothetical protein [Streptomyces sp. ISL-94]|uniref:hypothetical protein n=1 Tax=Streptomyces sp. ISL-94 TaxID=2819190 RepID=UPI001BE73E47|nr:hypothetical protein [Streptomyces sp. ISL-94]MBT2478136.1 hypothetical protein [Streptomyces sp. ISL-94]
MSALMELDARLDSEDTAVVLAAAWDVFGVTAELCDSITFEEGSDELQAMLAAQKCAAGRDLLPLPQTGTPVTAPPPGPGAAGLDPYVRLLEHTRQSLDRLLTTADSVGEGAAHALSEATALASGASVALTRVRER